MFSKTTFAFVAAALVAPSFAAANDSWAEQLGVEPGRYTLNELAQIAHAEPGMEREQRKTLIDRKNAAFRQMVADAATTAVVSSSN